MKKIAAFLIMATLGLFLIVGCSLDSQDIVSPENQPHQRILAHARIHNEIVIQTLERYAQEDIVPLAIFQNFESDICQNYEKYSSFFHLDPSKSFAEYSEEDMAAFYAAFPTPASFFNFASSIEAAEQKIETELENAIADGAITTTFKTKLLSSLATISRLDPLKDDSNPDETINDFIAFVGEEGSEIEMQIAGTFYGSYALNIGDINDASKIAEKYTIRDYLQVGADVLGGIIGGRIGGSEGSIYMAGALSALMMAMLDSEGCCGGDGAWGTDGLVWGG